MIAKLVGEGPRCSGLTYSLVNETSPCLQYSLHSVTLNQLLNLSEPGCSHLSINGNSTPSPLPLCDHQRERDDAVETFSLSLGAQ